MALYVTRPRRDEERIGRGLPSDAIADVNPIHSIKNVHVQLYRILFSNHNVSTKESIFVFITWISLFISFLWNTCTFAIFNSIVLLSVRHIYIQNTYKISHGVPVLNESSVTRVCGTRRLIGTNWDGPSDDTAKTEFPCHSSVTKEIFLPAQRL